MRPPRRLFRSRPRIPDLRDVAPDDDRRFLEMMGRLPREFHEAVARIERDCGEEAATVLYLLFFARYRGWDRVRAGGRVIVLDADLTVRGDWGFHPDRMGGPIAAGWEAIQP